MREKMRIRTVQEVVGNKGNVSRRSEESGPRGSDEICRVK